MTMRFDIERNAKPLIMALSAPMPGPDKNIKESIVDLTLIIEGYFNHISELNKEEAKKLLDKIANTTRLLVEVDESVSNTNTEIKEAFNYLMKKLSKLRSALHTAYTKDVPVIPTPSDFKEALSAVSRACVLQTLLKSN